MKREAESPKLERDEVKEKTKGKKQPRSEISRRAERVGESRN